ncbi:MAG: hypothetical protein ACKOBM_06335 [Gammaproteobacteria bacterium]
MSARKMAESLDVAAAENAASESGDRRTLALAVYPRRVLDGHGHVRRVAEAVSRRA